MPTVFFPLRTERRDRAQGIYSRQLPQLVAHALAGADVTVVEWTANKGGDVAHVLLTSSLPEDVIAHECAARDATVALLGSVSVSVERVKLTLCRWQGGRREELASLRCSTLVDAVQGAAKALADALGAGVALERIPPNDDAIRAWCFDSDNQALVDLAGLDVLLHRDDAFRHAVDVLRAAPEWQPARDLVQERHEGWAKRGLQVLADALSDAVREALPAGAATAALGDVNDSLSDMLSRPLSTPSS